MNPPTPISSRFELAPDERLPSTAFDRDQIVRVTDGVVCVALDEHDVVLTPGDSALIAAGERHRIWNGGDETARFATAAAAAPALLAA
jgi:quercetin dioxygenase-like cupin family protein